MRKLIVAVMIAGGNKATTVAFVLFGIGESIVHLLFGVLILRKLRHKGKRTIYGPGTITALLAFLPAAIYAWAWLTTQTVGAWDIAIGVLIIAFTMGIRDFVQGDYLSGTIRMIDALLIAASIAIGTGLVLSLTSLLTGVTVV